MEHCLPDTTEKRSQSDCLNGEQRPQIVFQLSQEQTELLQDEWVIAELIILTLGWLSFEEARLFLILIYLKLMLQVLYRCSLSQKRFQRIIQRHRITSQSLNSSQCIVLDWLQEIKFELMINNGFPFNSNSNILKYLQAQNSGHSETHANQRIIVLLRLAKQLLQQILISCKQLEQMCILGLELTNLQPVLMRIQESLLQKANNNGPVLTLANVYQFYREVKQVFHSADELNANLGAALSNLSSTLNLQMSTMKLINSFSDAQHSFSESISKISEQNDQSGCCQLGFADPYFSQLLNFLTQGSRSDIGAKQQSQIFSICERLQNSIVSEACPQKSNPIDMNLSLNNTAQLAINEGYECLSQDRASLSLHNSFRNKQFLKQLDCLITRGISRQREDNFAQRFDDLQNQ